MEYPAMQLKMYRWLNTIRATGKINMFGAAPYLSEAFGIPISSARKVLTEWMEWVSEDPERLND